MMKMMLVILTITTLSGCVAHVSNTQSSVPDWRLVYHHDQDGNRLAGNKAELIRLVQQGRPVRLYFPIRDILDHAADAGFLTVMNGELFAQTDSISRQMPSRADTRIALDAQEQSRWHALFSTTGELRTFQSKQGKLSDHRFEIKWFVFAPPSN